MVDLSGKYIKTENNAESGRLLKMAIAQGYKTPIGEKAMENCRLFHFLGSPYKTVSTPDNISDMDYDRIIRYSDLTGDEKEELSKIVDSTMRWCRAFGYDHVAVFANQEDTEYTGKGIANADDGMHQKVKSRLRKPVKISIREIEEKFGYPIEIVQ